MNLFKRSYFITLLFLICVLAAFGAGFFTHQYFFDTSSRFPVLAQAYQLLREHGLKDLPEAPALEYGMVRGMVQAYGDPYTSFLEPAQNELQSDSLHGSYGGVGVNVQKDAQGIWVLFPLPDSPAKEAGVQDGDQLTGVDDLPVTNDTTIDQIAAAVRGPVDSSVRLKVLRPADQTDLEFKIKRTEVSLPSVTYHLEPSEPRLGVIEVNLIAQSTPKEIEAAVNTLKERGATGFALDLRNNGGGLLNEGVEIARMFLKEGQVIQQQYRGQNVETYEVEAPGIFSDLPLVVLVNENTASAAEIIAGSLQAQGRVVLIGSQTYGKDTIQLVFSLKDGSSLHVTSAHWWIPGVEFPLNGHGLLPDIAVSSQDGSEKAIQAVIDYFFKS